MEQRYSQLLARASSSSPRSMEEKLFNVASFLLGLIRSRFARAPSVFRVEQCPFKNLALCVLWSLISSRSLICQWSNDIHNTRASEFIKPSFDGGEIIQQCVSLPFFLIRSRFARAAILDTSVFRVEQCPFALCGLFNFFSLINQASCIFQASGTSCIP